MPCLPIAVAMAAAVLLPAAVESQGRASVQPRASRAAATPELRAYLDLLDRFAGQDQAAAVRQLGSWPLRRVHAVLQELDKAGGITPAVFAFETGTALSLLKQPVPGYTVGPALQHIEEIGKLSERPGRIATAPAFYRTWYLAVAALLNGLMYVKPLELHLERALRAYPGDGELEMLAGCLEELKNTSRDHASSGSVATGLEPAIARYRRALASDPSLAEARVRLGWALFRIGNSAEAEAELRRARTLPLDRFLGALSALFLGRVVQHAGSFELADTLYREAARAYPSAQSLRIALSELQLAAGDETAARQTIEHSIGPGATGGDEDPWLLYPRGYWRRLDRLVDQLNQLAK